MRVVFPTKMSSSLVMATPGPGRTCSAPAGASTARAGRAACRLLPGARRFGARHPEPEKDHFRDKEGGGRSGEGRGVAPPPGGRGNPRFLVPAPGPHPHPYPGPACRKTSGVEANGQCPLRRQPSPTLPPGFSPTFSALFWASHFDVYLKCRGFTGLCPKSFPAKKMSDLTSKGPCWEPFSPS